MKIAIVYNRESKNVINLFGVPNREKYGQAAIARITAALKKGQHQVIAVEGDKDLIPRLEEFMPRVVKGERPGMVFNLSYGIQGQARYTHVPGILEMMGLPYVGSGPLAHSLALDKVVAKILFQRHGVPTPAFAMLKEPGFEVPALPFPMIVKPKNESTSFGLEVVHDEDQLRRAAQVILDEFQQPVLVEEYVDGREINVGLIGNSPPDALPPAELVFQEGPRIYTLEDKRSKSARRVLVRCPADLPPDLVDRAQKISREAFEALGCADCARVDLRLSPADELYVLEVNSLPSLGEHGSFSQAAAAAGLDFTALINRLVEVASARYFGTPQPPHLSETKRDRRSASFDFLTRNRDRLEARLQEWTDVPSRTGDPIGHDLAFRHLGRRLHEAGLRTAPVPAEMRSVRLWESEAGYQNGTLLIGHVDVPLPSEAPGQGFRKEPEWLYGEGIGVSRGPLVMLEFALRAVKAARALRRTPLGVLYYADEGRDCRYSADFIRTAAAKARRVLVLRPPTVDGNVVVGRRGVRKYQLVTEGEPQRLGSSNKKPDLLHWLFERMTALYDLNDRRARIALTAADVRTEQFPMMLPHRARLTLLVGYPTSDLADRVESRIRQILGNRVRRWELDQIADRPPMLESQANLALARELEAIAEEWEVPFDHESSVLPSAAGLVPHGIPVLCGLGPVVTQINTPHERISRISLVQRTLVLTQYLIKTAESDR